MTIKSNEKNNHVEDAMSPKERMALLHYRARQKDMTIMQAVEEFGCSYSHARLVLLNQRSPSPKLAKRISSFLGVSLLNLWGKEKFNEPYLSNVVPSQQKNKQH